MSGQVTPGVSIQDLETFRDDNRTSRHICRLRSCPHATVGFKSEELRLEHECSHVRKNLFPCIDPSCYYPPFLTVQALKAHTKTHHDVPIPRKYIRKPRPRSSVANPGSGHPFRQSPKISYSTSQQPLVETVSPIDLTMESKLPHFAKQSSSAAATKRAASAMLQDVVTYPLTAEDPQPPWSPIPPIRQSIETDQEFSEDSYGFQLPARPPVCVKNSIPSKIAEAMQVDFSRLFSVEQPPGPSSHLANPGVDALTPPNRRSSRSRYKCVYTS